MSVLVDVWEDYGCSLADGHVAQVLVAWSSISNTPGSKGGAVITGIEASGVGNGHTKLDRAIYYVLLGLERDLNTEPLTNEYHVPWRCKRIHKQQFARFSYPQLSTVRCCRDSFAQHSGY